MATYDVLAKIEFADGTIISPGDELTDDQLEAYGQGELEVENLIRDGALSEQE